MRNVPCRVCDHRHTGCHAECEEYKAAVEENEAMKKAKKADAEYNAWASDAYRRKEKRWRK